MTGTTRCPCGAGEAYGSCCAPLHRGEREAVTAEQLMRSRYSAFALGEADYLLQSWDETTRPTSLALPDVVWTRLRVLDVVDGGPDDSTGEVGFRAHFRRDGDPDALTERSTFRRDAAGRWRYLAGT